jgi:diamine N-acetyltransferase
MTPQQIRPATETDAAQLARLAAATFPLACPPGSPAADIDAFIAQHLSAERFGDYVRDPHRAVLVADDAGAFTGYAMLVFGEPHDPEVAAQLTAHPTAELSKLYVAPEHHGAGTARSLMGAALRVAVDRGAAGVWLGTNQENTRAQRFYAKCAFARVGTKRFALGARVEDDYIFEYVFS